MCNRAQTTSNFTETYREFYSLIMVVIVVTIILNFIYFSIFLRFQVFQNKRGNATATEGGKNSEGTSPHTTILKHWTDHVMN